MHATVLSTFSFWFLTFLSPDYAFLRFLKKNGYVTRLCNMLLTHQRKGKSICTMYGIAASAAAGASDKTESKVSISGMLRFFRLHHCVHKDCQHSNKTQKKTFAPGDKKNAGSKDSKQSKKSTKGKKEVKNKKNKKKQKGEAKTGVCDWHFSPPLSSS